MKKVIKGCIIACLLCGLLTVSAFAGDVGFTSSFSSNTGYTYIATGSKNYKTAAGAPWYLKINELSFGYSANVSGTLGMAHCPFYDSIARGQTYWATWTTTDYPRVGWLSGYGQANLTYDLRVRVDSLIYPGLGGAHTSGVWNSN